jgi:hypothetical protein
MCGWLAYSGSPILIEELLYNPDDYRDHGRGERVGVQVLERRQLAHALLLNPRERVTGTLPGSSSPAGGIEGDEGHRLGASRRPPRVWNEVPESSYGVVREGEDELRPFQPR